MNEQIELGLINTLKIDRVSDHGLYLVANDGDDVLLPNAYVTEDMKVGDSIEVFVYNFRVSLDEDSDRLIAMHKFNDFLSKDTKSLEPKQQVELIIREKTPLGYKVIADNLYDGMIFHNEIFEDIWIGQKKHGFIKKIRDDGKLDISLRPVGEDSNFTHRKSFKKKRRRVGMYI